MGTTQTTVIQLFRKWRAGDEAAGQEMAQKFSDWYFAISTIRVPGQEGRPAMEAACQAFAQGIITVTRPRALVDWAHGLLEKELERSGYGLGNSQPTGSDTPNAMTRNRSPVALLQSVADKIDPDHRRVLALAYEPSIDISVVDKAADALGGTPFAMLEARYALKRALRDHCDVPFSVLPESADMDRAPISLYEANRLASGKEVGELEQWLLTDIELCKDVAEYSVFVHALRAGALKAHAKLEGPAVEAAPLEAPSKAVPAPPASDTDSATTASPEPAPPTHPEPPSVEPAVTVERAPQTPDPAPVKPESVPAEQPENRPPAGKSLRAVLIIGATFVAAIVLIILMIVFALQAG